LDAALRTMASSGLDVTIDDVASEAGVSRRTVFRHFHSHGDLVAATVLLMRETVHANVPAPPDPGEDLREWLVASSISVHAMLRRVVGQSFWDLHVSRPGRPPEVVEALRGLGEMRRGLTAELAAVAWGNLGATGPTPAWVNDAFALQLSTFSTHVLSNYDATEAGRTCARILWAVLSDALGEQAARR
jgi:AcrR family transcriptional regulator